MIKRLQVQVLSGVEGENFLQGQLSVLTLISVSFLPTPTHPQPANPIHWCDPLVLIDYKFLIFIITISIALVDAVTQSHWCPLIHERCPEVASTEGTVTLTSFWAKCLLTEKASSLLICDEALAYCVTELCWARHTGGKNTPLDESL